jgi:hypothetical protein
LGRAATNHIAFQEMNALRPHVRQPHGEETEPTKKERRTAFSPLFSALNGAISASSHIPAAEEVPNHTQPVLKKAARKSMRAAIAFFYWTPANSTRSSL